MYQIHFLNSVKNRKKKKSVFLSLTPRQALPSGKLKKKNSDVWCPPKPVEKNLWGGVQDSTEQCNKTNHVPWCFLNLTHNHCTNLTFALTLFFQPILCPLFFPIFAFDYSDYSVQNLKCSLCQSIRPLLLSSRPTFYILVCDPGLC